MNQYQQTVINEWINTSNYVYNKTLEKIKSGHIINFYKLRDLLVTNNTKKNSSEYKYYNDIMINLHLTKKKILTNKNSITFDEDLQNIENEIKKYNKERRLAVKEIKAEKNKEIKRWELNTPKEIRAGAVNDVCKNYNSAFANLKANNITNFDLDYRKKSSHKNSILIQKSLVTVSNNNENIILAPTFLKEHSKIKINKKILKNQKLEINHDIRLQKINNKYYLHIPVDIPVETNNTIINYCGIDPGLRSFMTCFGNNNCLEYKHNKLQLNKLNKEIDKLKGYKNIKKTKSRIRKRALTKRETKKSNLVDELHWKTINQILKNNDVIFYGDIKSHNIVKHKKYKHINRAFNDLKLYLFKTRLLYKSSIKNKYVFLVNEAYTTQTCSFCGSNNKPKSSEVYYCSNCNINIGRDVNASKNILMKGIISKLY